MKEIRNKRVKSGHTQSKLEYLPIKWKKLLKSRGGDRVRGVRTHKNNIQAEIDVLVFPDSLRYIQILK